MRLLSLSLFAFATLAYFAATPSALAQSSGTATLTVQFDQAPSTSSTRVLELMANGSPPSSAIEFVDSSGTHEATGYVMPLAPTANCPHAQILHTGLGDSPWCLKVRKLTTGVALTGTLVGPNSTVTLTLNSRDALLWPVIATVCALVLALALLYVVSYGLPSWIPKAQLQRRVSRDGGRIGGLGGWVAEAEAHSSLANIASQERWMKRTGVTQVRNARLRLKGALESSDAIPKDAPLRMVAEQEAEIQPTDPVAASDMLSPDVSHAAALLVLVERAQKFIVEWEQQIRALDARHGADGEGSTHLLNEGRKRLETLSPWTINAIESSLREHLFEVSGAPPRPLARFAYETDTLMQQPYATFALADLRLSARFAPIPVAVARSARRLVSVADLAAAGVITVGAVIALVLVAAATALAANYASNHTFGSFADYATLTTSTFGSTSVATILGVGLLWTKIRNSKA